MRALADVVSGDLLERGDRERAADRSRDRSELSSCRGQAVDPGDEEILERGREEIRAHGDRPRPPARLQASLEQGPRELLEIEGVPLRLPHESHPRDGVDLALEDSRQHLLGCVVRQGAEGDLGGSVAVVAEGTQAKRRALRAGGELLGEHQCDRRTLGEVENRLGKLPRGGVRPVHVLERDDDRLLPRKRFQPADVRLPDPLGASCVLRRCRLEGAGAGRGWEARRRARCRRAHRASPEPSSEQRSLPRRLRRRASRAALPRTARRRGRRTRDSGLRATRPGLRRARGAR